MIWSPTAIIHLARLRDFLLERDSSSAERARDAIKDGVRMLDELPHIGRPVPDEDGDVRDWLIDFGRKGYKVRYLYENGEVTILAVRHMRESEFYPARIPDA